MAFELVVVVDARYKINLKFKGWFLFIYSKHFKYILDEVVKMTQFNLKMFLAVTLSLKTTSELKLH